MSGLTNGITPADYVGFHFEPNRWSRAGALDARHACKRCKDYIVDGGTLKVSYHLRRATRVEDVFQPRTS